MIRAAIQHPILTWALVWSTTGAALVVSDVFSTPRRGPLWPAFLVGIVAWAIGGIATVGDTRPRTGAAIWSAAFVVVMWLGSVWGDWFGNNRVGGLSSAGFVGMLLGLSVAAGIAACVSGLLLLPARLAFRAAGLGLAWAGGFLIGGYSGVVAAYLLGGLVDAVAPWPAFIFGWGLGCGAGGLVASGIGIKARDALLGAAT